MINHTAAMEINNMEIIDSHSHLGNNHYPNGGELIEKTGVKTNSFDAITIVELAQYRQSFIGDIYLKIFHWWLAKSTIDRIFTATRENMRNSMDEAGVAYTVCLPMSLNFVSFEDLLKAKAKDPGIIPFTGIDHTKNYDYNQVYTSHVKAGAKGLKLHPIVQRLPLNHKKTFEIVEAFAPYGLPVLFHSGALDYYYREKEKVNQIPELGEVKYAEELVRAFPKVKFIAGHAGTTEIDDTIALLGKYKNVWVDTSFQSPGNIRRLVITFGAEKVLYASDWPYGSRSPAIKAVKKACRGDKSLERLIFCDNARALMKLS